MSKRKLEELNLLDDFLFGSMVTYPEIGENFSRRLLSIIFQREFGRLKIVPQKVYYGSDTDKHGARLDVYLEEGDLDELNSDNLPMEKKEERESLHNSALNATIYDVEPDKNDDVLAVEALPKRVRFYHAKIDGRSLKSGESYHALKNVIIIMITSYDPFDLNRMVYTIKNGCVEVPDMPYDDGAMSIFLYTRGTEGQPPEELIQLMHYMEHTTEQNAVTEELKAVHQMVEQVKHDEEVSLEYMKIFEREEMLKNQGRKEGRAEGKAEDILELLTDCGPVPENIKEKILSQTDMSVLTKWLKLAAKADTIEQFTEKM